MSRSKRIFGLIKKSLTGVELCNDMLVVLPTESILRGFLIEATSQKGRVYLWRVVAPLHRPMSHVILDYSTRIQGSEPEIYIDSKAYSDAAVRIRAIVGEHIEYLQRIRSPADFLRYINDITISRSTTNFKFDLALTYYRIGRIRDCDSILKLLPREIDEELQWRKIPLPIDDQIKEAARAMQSDPAALGALLDRWESMNIETLGLQSSRSFPEASGPSTAPGRV